MDTHTTRLPLLPLPDLVHFPKTELRLKLNEPGGHPLIRDLMLARDEERWLGTVLLKPSSDLAKAGQDYVGQQSYVGQEVFSAGTAARVLELEDRIDGYEILLRGAFRFELKQELSEHSYREAMVLPLEEPHLSDVDPGIMLLKDELLTCTGTLIEQLHERFPISEELQAAMREDVMDFEQVVNRIAATVDLSPMRKLQLLNESLPDRALELRSILRSQLKVLDLLHPFRHLERCATYN
jgi:Lon protease-like protein